MECSVESFFERGIESIFRERCGTDYLDEPLSILVEKRTSDIPPDSDYGEALEEQVSLSERRFKAHSSRTGVWNWMKFKKLLPMLGERSDAFLEDQKRELVEECRICNISVGLDDLKIEDTVMNIRRLASKVRASTTAEDEGEDNESSDEETEAIIADVIPFLPRTALMKEVEDDSFSMERIPQIETPEVSVKKGGIFGIRKPFGAPQISPPNDETKEMTRNPEYEISRARVPPPIYPTSQPEPLINTTLPMSGGGKLQYGDSDLGSFFAKGVVRDEWNADASRSANTTGTSALDTSVWAESSQNTDERTPRKSELTEEERREYEKRKKFEKQVRDVVVARVQKYLEAGRVANREERKRLSAKYCKAIVYKEKSRGNAGYIFRSSMVKRINDYIDVKMNEKL